MKIDPRSDRIALHYTGNDAGEPAISGVPARDLTENDIDRLVYVEHGDGLHGAAYQAAVDKKLDELREGPYRVTPEQPKSSKAAKPSEPATEAPAAPAEPSADSAEGVNSDV